MQSYLKTRPVLIQLLLFLGMSFGIYGVISLLGGSLLSNVTGIDLIDFANPKNWSRANAGMITFIRGMMTFQFLGLFLIPSLFFAYFSDPQPLHYIGLKKTPNPFYYALGIAALLIALPLVEYTGLLNRQIHFSESSRKWMQSLEDQAVRQIQFMLGKNTVPELLMNIIFIALFAGVGEELFFRGVLQRLFIRIFKNAWAGIIITAVLFSAFHFQFFGFIPRLLLGVLLGAVYWYSGSLWPAIVAHFVYDAFFIVLVFLNPRMIENTEATLFNASGLLVMALVSAALVGGIIWLMKKASTTSYEQVYAGDTPKDQDIPF